MNTMTSELKSLLVNYWRGTATDVISTDYLGETNFPHLFEGGKGKDYYFTLQTRDGKYHAFVYKHFYYS